jgi:class 3 adenylate cyclase/putative methionine-R-sulfoxide reductase with GAF domain
VNFEQFSNFANRVFDGLGVDTITIYTGDPWTGNNQYRLLWMNDGIEDKTPMYGPVHPKKMEDRLLGSPGRHLPIPNVHENMLFKDSSFMRRERIKSLIRFHLPAEKTNKDQKPGAILFLSYRHKEHFEHDYLRQIERAVLAIETILQGLDEASFQDPKRLAQQTKWLAQIARATRDIIGEKDVEKVIEIILRSSLEITGAGDESYACIHIIQPDRKLITCEYRVWRGEFISKSEDPVDMAVGKGITTKAARDERPLLLQDIQEVCGRWPERYSYVAHRLVEKENCAMRSELVVPMYAQGRAIGVLNVESPHVGTFYPDHLRIMAVLADVAAIAIIESKFDRQLNSIVQSASRIDLSQDFGIVAQQMREYAKSEMKSDDSDFWEYENGEFKSILTGATGKPRSEKEDREKGLSEWVLTEGIKEFTPPVKALLVTKMNHQTLSCELEVLREESGGMLGKLAAPAGIPRIINLRMDKDTLSEAGLPLVFDKAPIGVLWVKWHSEHVFTEQEKRLLLTLSNQASLAQHISKALSEPLEEPFRRIYRDVLGSERADFFAKDRDKLLAQFVPRVTVMFADIRGSSKVMSVLRGTREGQELLLGITRAFYEKATEIVQTHKGVSATFLGDGVMAIFGCALMPDEKKEPGYYAQQAALAALELADYFENELDNWKEQIFRNAQGAPVPEEFGLGVGLHTDWAMVGNFAVGEGFQFTAVGRAPTIAARVQDKARVRELKEQDLLPDDVPADAKVIVLCTAYMKQFFQDSSGVVLIPLKQDVYLKGVDGTFKLGVLKRRKQ